MNRERSHPGSCGSSAASHDASRSMKLRQLGIYAAARIFSPHGSQMIARSGLPHAFWPQREHVNFVLLFGARCSPGRCALSRLSFQFVAASRS
jgi:hypothetical protein